MVPPLAIGDEIQSFDDLRAGRSEGILETRSTTIARSFLGIASDDNVLHFVRGQLASISARVADADKLLSRLVETYGAPRRSWSDTHSWVSHGLLIEVDVDDSAHALLRVETPRFATYRIQTSAAGTDSGRIPAGRRTPVSERQSAGHTPSPIESPLSPAPPRPTPQWMTTRQEAFIYSGTVKQAYSAPLVLGGSLGLAGVLVASVLSAANGTPLPAAALVPTGITGAVFLLTGIGLHNSAHSDFVRAGVITPAPKPEPETVW